MKLYRIRNTKTGKYSRGGFYPDYNERGKIWNTPSALNSHILTIFKYQHNYKNVTDAYAYEELEVIEYELVEVKRTPFTEYEASLKEKKDV